MSGDEQERARAAVEQAADALEEAEALFVQRIHEAHEEGLSLRQIAEAAMVSHEQIRRLVGQMVR